MLHVHQSRLFAMIDNVPFYSFTWTFSLSTKEIYVHPSINDKAHKEHLRPDINVRVAHVETVNLTAWCRMSREAGFTRYKQNAWIVIGREVDVREG